MAYADQRAIKTMFVTWNIWIYPILNNVTSPEGLNVKQTNLRTIDYVRTAVNLSFDTCLTRIYTLLPCQVSDKID
jgi:hypothetical protein